MSSSTATAETFPYDQSLIQDEIRLMRIETSTKPEELRFSLERHLRKDAPSYVALSYTCGTEPPLHSILINGRTMKLRPSLWTALYYIVTEAEAIEKKWQYIWCDAICINQPNLEEKSEQIRAMYTTYRQADVVIAWLGIDRNGKYDQRTADAQQDPGLWKDVKRIMKTDIFEEEILTSEYWTRMWIVQEAVAARKFIPMYGRTRIGSTQTSAAARAVGTLPLLGVKHSEIARPSQILQLGFYHGFEGLLDKVWAPAKKVLPDLADPNVYNLIQWLRFTEDAACANAKDRVFSLLNLLPTRDRAVLDRFFPDYELSLERIQLITFGYIRQGGSAEAMWLKGVKKSEKRLDAFKLLRVRSKALQQELEAKSKVSESYLRAHQSHGVWAWKHLRQHTKANFLGYGGGDETWLSARIRELSMIGSQPLAGELHAQRQLLKARAWYIAPPDVANDFKDSDDEAEE